MKKSLVTLALTTVLGAASFVSQAANIDVSITNATKGIYFTPLLVVAHSSDIHLFQAGTAAPAEVKSMAEGGDISGLSSVAANAGAVVSEDPAGGILNPGDSATATLDTGSADRLSITAMLLPTNDGFVGLDSWAIPSTPGTYTIRLNGYDAGTEANDELKGSMPQPPFITFGENGTGVETSITNSKIHIHPGNLGDSDPAGGKSDLDSSAHRWLNPVAVVTVTVK